MKNKTLVIVSGYFNPVHSGHVSLFKEAKKLGDKLVVIVNNDTQVKVKGHFPFMSEEERQAIVGSMESVDLVYLSKDKDRSVSNTMEEIYSKYKRDYIDFVFANGGERKKAGLPEYKTCEKLGIKMIFDVGGKRKQSSSSLIQNTRACKTHKEKLEYCKKCLKEKS